MGWSGCPSASAASSCASPGRALVAEAKSLIVRVDARRGNELFINDGSYGTLFDATHMGFNFPVRLIGQPVDASEPLVPFSFWGPTCDTIDFMKGPFLLPGRTREGDYIEIGNTGAYGRAIAGRFNGYGHFDEAILLDEPMLTMYPLEYRAQPAAGGSGGAAGPGVTIALDYLPADASFLDPVRADAHDPGTARAIVLPFGLEASVSYGGGTAAGPQAILRASQQLELYDEELGCEPYLGWGVAARARAGDRPADRGGADTARRARRDRGRDRPVSARPRR